MLYILPHLSFVTVQVNSRCHFLPGIVIMRTLSLPMCVIILTGQLAHPIPLLICRKFSTELYRIKNLFQKNKKYFKYIIYNM